MRILALANNEKTYLKTVSEKTAKLIESMDKLEQLLQAAAPLHVYEKAKFYRDEILTEMDNARSLSDKLESIFPKDLWPFPSYTDILYSVK